MTASCSSCNCIVLASAAVGQILACPDCGTLHLHLPQVTLRMPPDRFSELSVIVAKAERLLAEARARLAATQTGVRALH